VANPQVKLRNIKLVIEYDGTRFLGFQKQKKGRTVQHELEKTLLKILRERVHIIAAGRTDSGVHARGQVVNFQTRRDIPLGNLWRALNTYLPDDLAVKKASEVRADFHSRFAAKRKVYRYRVLSGPAKSPLARFYSYHYFYPLNLPVMRKAAKLLVGKHDFRSFQAHSNEKRSSSVRTIYRAEIKKENPFFVFVFEGNGFLYNMVRNMVGTLLWLGREKISLKEFGKIVEGRDRRLAGPTVPAHGLMLEKVIY